MINTTISISEPTVFELQHQAGQSEEVEQLILLLKAAEGDLVSESTNHIFAQLSIHKIA